MPADHVIVFGDSLSDIGRKWKQPMGRVAGNLPSNGLRMLAVSATGRFSDSKNWTDYMFEAAAGQGLIASTREETILNSGEYHRLSSRWIEPPGGSRFRYANYAVGGAVGWKEESFGKWLGLTRFSDQVDEFWEDFRKLPDFNDSFRPGHEDLGKFLFIVMFGANDIYTDEKEKNVSGTIGNAIIKQCEKVFNIVKRVDPAPNFVVAGVGKPEQSAFYASQLANKRMVAEACRHHLQQSNARYLLDQSLQNRLSRAEAEDRCSSAEKEEREFREKCLKLGQQADSLNGCLSQACHQKKQWHFFPMREALLLLQGDAPSLNIDAQKAQGFQHFHLTSHKVGNIHFANPNDPRLKLATGQHALFTADQKHPTSIGYKYLWKRMELLLRAAGLTFGILAGPPAGIAVPRKRIWQKDSEVRTCQFCHKTFGVFTRKHHCRQCGGIFCDKCSKHTATLDDPLTETGSPGKRAEVRICIWCHAGNS
jgi:hypothetical protein